MKKLYSILFCIFSIFLLNGCSQKDVSLNYEKKDSHIFVQDSYIKDYLKFEKLNYFKRTDGLIVVEAKFNNISETNKKIAYKIDWIDKNGFTQKTILSRWIAVEVEQKRNLTIRGIAPSAKIESFLIRIQAQTDDDKNRQDSYHSEYQN